MERNFKFDIVDCFMSSDNNHNNYNLFLSIPLDFSIAVVKGDIPLLDILSVVENVVDSLNTVTGINNFKLTAYITLSDSLKTLALLHEYPINISNTSSIDLLKGHDDMLDQSTLDAVLGRDIYSLKGTAMLARAISFRTKFSTLESIAYYNEDPVLFVILTTSNPIHLTVKV